MFACTSPYKCLYLRPFSLECPISTLHMQLSTEMSREWDGLLFDYFHRQLWKKRMCSILCCWIPLLWKTVQHVTLGACHSLYLFCCIDTLMLWLFTSWTGELLKSTLHAPSLFDCTVYDNTFLTQSNDCNDTALEPVVEVGLWPCYQVGPQWCGYPLLCGYSENTFHHDLPWHCKAKVDQLGFMEKSY